MHYKAQKVYKYTNVRKENTHLAPVITLVKVNKLQSRIIFHSGELVHVVLISLEF